MSENNSNQNLHEGHRKRLREKFMAGKQSFKEHDLLELLLGYSIARKDTNELAHKLINRFSSLEGVLNADPALLSTVEGIGEKTACFLSLVGYVARSSAEKNLNKKPLTSIADAKEQISHLFKGYDHEVFFMIFLNAKNKVTGYNKLDSNKKDSVSLDFNELTKGLITNKPSAVIIAHNHFTDFPYPSKEDDEATKRIYTLLMLHKVSFYDHIIVGNKEIYSYFYDNKLQKIKEEINDKLSF
ncbi:MAG: hypothetical protein J6R29_06345 [Clostridia bacterium]|nr:hypothetical protein [Clostridia bacterium]